MVTVGKAVRLSPLRPAHSQPAASYEPRLLSARWTMATEETAKGITPTRPKRNIPIAIPNPALPQLPKLRS